MSGIETGGRREAVGEEDESPRCADRKVEPRVERVTRGAGKRDLHGVRS